MCLRRLGREVAAGGVKRPFAHWRAVAAPDVKPGPNHFVASVTDGAGFPRPRSREWDFEHGSSPLATEMKPGRMFHGAQVSKNPAPQGGEPGLRRDRHRQGPAFRGGRGGTQRGAGAFVRRLYPRSGGDGGVAGVVRGDQGGDGIDLGLLDTGLRDAGARGLRGDARAAAHDEADRRAQERRAGLPVDLAADVLRPAAGSVPSGRRGLPAALLRTPDEAADRGPLPLRPAHAEGADRDERQARLGDRQHHGTDRPAHPARDHRRRA